MADPGHTYSDERIGAIAEQVRAIYAEASEGAEKGLAEWLESFAEKDADMRSKVEAGEMTERQWRDWRRHQMIQGRRWRELKRQLAEGFTTANEQAAQIINGELSAIAAENANWAAFSVEKAAGVGTSFALQDAGTVHALLSEAAGLSVATVAVNAAADVAWNRKGIQSAMTQGIMLGESIPKMAQRMRRVGAANRAQAVRWARTYATAAENAGRVASYKRAQGMGIGLKQEWLATLDTRTRHSHRQLDGERREVGEKFSNGCRYPGDPQAPYAEVCNCRCTLVAAVDGIDQSQADRWSRLPEGMTYGEWKGEKRAEAAVSGMASADGIEWPKHGSIIRRSEFVAIRNEASRHGVKLVSFSNSDVDPAAARLAVDAAAKALGFDKRIASAFPDGLTLELSGMFSGDFATTSKRSRTSILLNREAMRDVRALRKEYSNLASEGWFVAGTEADAIVFHEIGHSLAYASCIDPLKIASAITGKKDAELLEYVKTNLSKYAGSHENGIEIPSEAFSAFASGVSNEFAERFVGELLRRLR